MHPDWGANSSSVKNVDFSPDELKNGRMGADLEQQPPAQATEVVASSSQDCIAGIPLALQRCWDLRCTMTGSTAGTPARLTWTIDRRLEATRECERSFDQSQVRGRSIPELDHRGRSLVPGRAGSVIDSPPILRARPAARSRPRCGAMTMTASNLITFKSGHC